METTTAFDLNDAIQKWRDNLAQSPAFRAENLEELEAHLRESIAGLESRGLLGREAFLVATERMGKGEKLQLEFGKVNERAVRLDRILWILVGAQLMFFGHMFMGAAGAVTQCIMSLTSIMNPSSLAVPRGEWVSFGSQFLLPLVLFLAAWRLLKRVETLPLRLRALVAQPLRLARYLFVATFFMSAVYHAVLWCLLSPAQGHGSRSLAVQLGLYSLLAVIPGALCLLATAICSRKRQRCGTA